MCNVLDLTSGKTKYGYTQNRTGKGGEGGGKHEHDIRYGIHPIPRQSVNEGRRRMGDSEREGFAATSDRTPYVEIEC